MKKIVKIHLIFVWLFLIYSCNNQANIKTIAIQDSALIKNEYSNISTSEKQDNDSLKFYLQKCYRLKKEHKADLALEELNFALYYASTPQEIEIVKKEIMEVGL